MKYLYYQVYTKEIPDEISLGFSITGCPIHCPECHSPHTWDANLGTKLDQQELTRIVNSQSSGRMREAQYEVTLTNNKSEAVDVDVIHRNHSTNVEILNPSITLEKRDAFTHVFKVRIPAGRTVKLTFTERVSG